MKFFDFHVHPALKPTFMQQDSQSSVWQHIAARLSLLGMSIGINSLFNETLNSQSCLGQLFNGNVKLFGIALHAPESNMAKGLLEKKPVNKGAIPLIDADRLRWIASGNHYFDLINEELVRLQKPSPPEMAGAQIKILSTNDEFDETDDKTIYGFLIVEGLHCFFGDQSAPDADDVHLSNFEKLTDEHTVIAINICHLQQAHFCNHAFGIQFLNIEFFYPTGNGISDKGWQMIQRMIEKNILVDIKHMSLKSRFQLFSHFRNMDNNSFPVPFICTHAGVTGMRWNDRVKYLYQPVADRGAVYEVQYLKPQSPHVKQAYFNCSSINLYDEDIEAILLSGGLIGISFDQRILGFADENVLTNVTTPHDVEYISKDEASFFFGPVPPTMSPVNHTNTGVWLTEDFENYDNAFDPIIHPLFFLNNILHILHIAKNNENIGTAKAIKQLCLGSDYDGLINAIDNCKRSDELFIFYNYAIDHLPRLLQDAGLHNEGIDVRRFADDLFYNNGRNFVLNRLRIMQS